jgi:hypothetical protein
MPSSRQKPRLLVLTDISSLTTGEREPDDGQSLIRLMLYANEVDIEGLIASSNMGHGTVTRPELIRSVIDAYEKVRPQLLLHSPDYPPADQLRTLVKGGQPAAGPKVPVEESVGAGKDTEASEWILRTADRPDPRPLWITIWGGSADLAQALWKARQTRTAAEVKRLTARLRIHAVGDQDSTGPWIRANFPDLFYITRGFAIRGMYRGGDTSLTGSDWVETHLHSHGPLGDLYPNYRGGDIWSARLGTVRGIKEGDTPSYLGLIPTGLGNPEHPEWGSWGGRMEKTSAHRFGDAVDAVPGAERDPDPHLSSVDRWRPDYQADFQARMDWCTRSFREANHAPVVRLRGPQEIAVKSGRQVKLDAGGSSDPDGNRLSFHWWVYREAGTCTEPIQFDRDDLPHLSFRAPRVSSPQTLHLIVTVQDNGAPPLTRYGRTVITFLP